MILGIIAGFALAKLTTKKSSPSDERVIKKSEKEKQKNKNLDEILLYLKEHKEITNNDIEELLKVSDATVTRYLDKLEEQGKIEQIGEKGRYVKYRLR